MGKTLQKSLTVAVSAMTAMWSVGVAAFAPLAAAAAPTASAVSSGDLVKASLPAVYYVGANGKRYVFPNEKTYKTWWNNFSAVETITDAELAAVAIGGNVTYRPGARLAKITTDPKVYMVGAAAELHSISDEATAKDLFGSTWAQKIDDVPDAFFTNYTVSSDVVATGLGLGALPVGTIVSFEGENYLIGSDDVHLVNGDVSIYSAVVMAGSNSEFEAWTGLASSEVTDEVDASDIMDLVSPDRTGFFDDEDGTTIPPQSGVSVEVKSIATNLSMASTVSQNLGKNSTVEVCSDATTTVNGFSVTTVNGTIGFNNLIAWFQAVTSGEIYEITGTSNGDSVGQFEATDAEVSFSGCKEFAFYAASTSNGGVLNLRLVDVTYTGAAAAATLNAGNAVLQNRNAVPVADADLMDIVFATPVAPASLQTDGTKQQIFTVQASVNNNDAYIPNVVFKLNGSIMVSGCELRISGTVASTNYKWVGGKYIVFELPEDKRVMTETTKTWELWCNVDGEAGQTVTPALVWPAPYFWFFDNVRATAAGTEASIFTGSVSKEGVAPQGTRISVPSAAAITLAGASITFEVATLSNVKNTSGVNLDSSKTSGSTNDIVAVYKAKVRGSKATLSRLTIVMGGAAAAKGMTGCQIKIGQRNDKGEIVTSSINLADYSFSNFGSENSVLNVNVPVIATKQMQVGDWLIIVECDVVTAGAAYANNDALIMTLVTGVSNVSFDVGTNGNAPASTTAATTITVKLLTSLTVASNATTRFLVSNATDVVLGSFTITGPSQEGVNVSSIGITFEGSGAAANNIVGVDGCTTVTLKDASGVELTTSQALTIAAPAADITLTFSVTFPVTANTQYVLNVVCVQAASAPAAGTVTAATTLATISGTGALSSQSFSNSPALAGANVTKAASGTVTSSLGQSQPNQIIGPSEQLKVMTISSSANILEDQFLNRIRITLTAASTALASDLSTVTLKGEGFAIAGTAAAAEQTFCTRTVTGATPVTIDCELSDGLVTLAAGQTGSITVYVTGNSLGNIGADTTPTDGIITPSLDLDTDSDSQIIFKGAESQVSVFNTSDPAAANGRLVTPAGATVRVVGKGSQTFLAGGPNMTLGQMDLIVSGTSIMLEELSGQCNPSNAATVCLAASDTVTIALNGTPMTSGTNLALAGASPSLFDGSGISSLITLGTSALELRYTDNGTVCAADETLYLATTEFGFTVTGSGGTQSFASAGSGAFPVTVLPDFNNLAGNIMTHPINTCG